MERDELDRLFAEALSDIAKRLDRIERRSAGEPLIDIDGANERGPFTDAIKERIERGGPGSGRALTDDSLREALKHGRLPQGHGTWAPQVEADTKKARLNDGVQTKAEEDELREKIEAFRRRQESYGSPLR